MSTFKEWVDAYGDCPCALDDVYELCPEHDKAFEEER